MSTLSSAAARPDARLLARGELSLGRPDLPQGQSAARSAPRRIEDIKPRLLGHWGTTPGLNFIYTHLNRLITEHDLNMMYMIGPGHGGPGIVAHTYLEGSYSEIYPDIGQSRDGMRRLFRQFSWPYGIPSHVAPETPGSIHEGGELGLLAAARLRRGVRQPRPDRRLRRRRRRSGDRPCADSWHSTKFLNPAQDGAVLPILHLNGYKIANPTVLARIPHEELTPLFAGYGYAPHFLEGDDPRAMHEQMAAALDAILAEIRPSRSAPGRERPPERPRWPMLILRTPKGWTGPKVVDGKPVEGTWRSHQVPLAELREKPEHLEHARRLDAELSAGGAVRCRRQASSRSWRRSPRRAAAAWA